MMQRRSVLLAVAGFAAALAAPVASRAAADDAADALVFAAPSDSDLALVRKAVDVVQKNAVLVVSDLKVRGSGNGVYVTINATIHVTGHFPGRFRSEVKLLDEAGKTTVAQYQVNGDGTNVYTYSPDKKQYSVQSAQDFKSNFAGIVPAVGILCGLIASGDPWGDPETPNDAFLNAVTGMGMAVESAAGTAGQRVVQIRPTKPDGGDFHVQLTVDPATSGFVAMRMLGKFGEMRFTVTETIKSLAKLSEESAGDFAYTPPAGATKVDKLGVLPF